MATDDRGGTVMTRRGVFGAVGALAAAALTGCGGGGGGKALQAALNEAAGSVDGVDSTNLELVSGANFEKALRGSISTSAGSRTQAVDVFGQAMSAIATAAVEQGDAEVERNRVVGAVTALTSDGEELSIWDLRPDLQSSKGRLDAVTIADFLDE